VSRRRRGSQRHRSGRGRALPAGRAPAGSFEALVERALDAIPPPFDALLERVAVVIEDEPTAEQLRENGLRPDETLYGLYEGTPITEYAADWVPFPNRITLFRRPLEEDYPDPDELAEEVTATVVHELAHHVGMDDRRLRELGWD